jgi:hypothetical protein
VKKIKFTIENTEATEKKAFLFLCALIPLCGEINLWKDRV